MIILGITGGIAAYKTPELVRALASEKYDVHCVLTEAAAQFVTPLTLQTLSGNPVRQHLFDLNEESQIGHIELADHAQALIIAPATAHCLAKIAHGLCDDLLSTAICATKAPVIFAPAMNVNMWENPAVQANVQRLREFGYTIIPPESGELACGHVGEGRLPEIKTIVSAVHDACHEHPATLSIL